MIDKELEIRRQFLDEAQEYLDTLDSAILGIASSRVDIQKINAALRAAHSIKGGAAMMGFDVLSSLAHRLEDSFKVLKTQKFSEIEAQLENLLLTAVTCLRTVIQFNRQDQPIDSQWLETDANRIFDQLHEQLGDPEAEDANSILAPEEGQDIVPMLFETEVEGCLQRLEAVLEHPEQPCLQEELTILAQELGGLGEMLQLDAFSHLCTSVVQWVESEPDEVVTIAQSALKSWRRSQALVLAGQLDLLPAGLDGFTAIPFTPSISTATPSETWQTFEDDPLLEEPEGFEPLVDHGAAWELQGDWDQVNWDQEGWNQEGWNQERWDQKGWNQKGWDQENWDNAIVHNAADFVADPGLADSGLVDPDLINSNLVEPDLVDSNIEFINDAEGQWVEPATDAGEEESFAIERHQATPAYLAHSASASLQHTEGQSAATETPATDFKILEIKADSSTSIPDEDQTATVRVLVRQLNQLNDLFGELTIERNGLDLYLKRLRGLVQTLTRRVRSLDQSNAQMRAAYDKSNFRSPITDFRFGKVNGDASAISSAQLAPSLNTTIQNLESNFDVLEMDQYNDLHLLSQQVMETIVQIQETTSDIELSLDDTDQTARNINKTSKQLQSNLTQIRMRPLADVVDRFPRALRELCLQHGKQARLSVIGNNTLVDRNILESLNDPLMHLLRNAFDHGIEDPETRRAQGKPAEGVIEIRAAHRGNRTIISISDDGKGIPLDKIRSRAEQMGLDSSLLATASDADLLSLIFEPGFSTTDQVTSLSGRGVGMDVVRNSLNQVRGEITVNTQAGTGTTFTLSVPLTLSVLQVLMVESNGMLLAIPTDAVEEILLLDALEVITTAGSESINWDGELVQLLHLARWLKFNCPHQPHSLETPPNINAPTVLLVNQGSNLVGLQVDRCWGEQEVAIRRVEGSLPMPSGFIGCAIVADGRVVPLINIAGLLDWIGQNAPVSSTHAPRKAAPALAPTTSTPAPPEPLVPKTIANRTPTKKTTILIVDDSINVRRFLALTLERAGFRVEQAKDGQDAVDKLKRGMQVQAVVCDIEMPRLDGYGFLAKVKSDPNLEQLPVAMLTSRSGDKHRQLAVSLGASAYFSKPYNEQELIQTLNQLVQTAAANGSQGADVRNPTPVVRS